jgi:hypothetical protein
VTDAAVVMSPLQQSSGSIVMLLGLAHHLLEVLVLCVGFAAHDCSSALLITQWLNN